MERETGIEPATNSLEGCDSTTELLPPLLLLKRFGSDRDRSPPALRLAALAQGIPLGPAGLP